MEHAGVVVQRMLITRDEPAEILEPRKEPFGLPPAAIATQGPTILGQLSFAGATLPSMKASSRSNPPRLCNYSASASSTPRITPERTHC